MMIDMFVDWLTGTGPDRMRFTEGSPQVESMKRAPGVQAAREDFRWQSRVAAAGGQQVQPLRRGVRFRSPQLIFEAGASTRQFVGSDNVEITPTGKSMAHFKISNTTSMTSFAYQVGVPSWERSSFGPGGNVRQTFEWDERIRP
jgi:hypothetical protein